MDKKKRSIIKNVLNDDETIDWLRAEHPGATMEEIAAALDEAYDMLSEEQKQTTIENMKKWTK